MSNNKQNSIDLIFETLNLLSDYSFRAWMLNNYDELKAMHKKEMKDCYLSHVAKAEKLRQIFEKQFEQYYNETFGETKN